MDTIHVSDRGSEGRTPGVWGLRKSFCYRIGYFALAAACVSVAGSVVYLGYSRQWTIRSTSTGPIVCRAPTWDCGAINQTALIRFTHTFKLDNLSNQLVPILNVVADCGCIVTDKKPSHIEPGAAGELMVNISPAPKPGPFRKSVHVILGTSPVSKLTLTIQGSITGSSDLYLVPKQLDFGILDKGETRVRPVKLSRYNGHPIGFVRAIPQSDALSVNDQIRRDNADSVVELSIMLNGSQLNSGDQFQSAVIVQTDHPEFKDVKIPIVARVSRKDHGFVETLKVDRLAKGTFQDRQLAAPGATLPVVESIRYEGEGPISAELLSAHERGVDSVPVVRVSRSSELTKPRIYHGTLIVTLGGNKEPVRIPINAYLPD